jgi:hypothetical protein
MPNSKQKRVTKLERDVKILATAGIVASGINLGFVIYIVFSLGNVYLLIADAFLINAFFIILARKVRRKLGELKKLGYEELEDFNETSPTSGLADWLKEDLKTAGKMLRDKEFWKTFVDQFRRT